jgi:hypothetical protein
LGAILANLLAIGVQWPSSWGRCPSSSASRVPPSAESPRPSRSRTTVRTWRARGRYYCALAGWIGFLAYSVCLPKYGMRVSLCFRYVPDFVLSSQIICDLRVFIVSLRDCNKTQVSDVSKCEGWWSFSQSSNQ